MNVYIIASWYPSDGRPMNSTFIRQHALALAKNGAQVTVLNANIVSFRDKEKLSFSKRDFNGISEYQFTLPAYRFGNKNIEIKLTKHLISQLYRKAKKERGMPDIIHIHASCFAGIAGVSLAKKAGIPCVVTEHFSKIAAGTLDEIEKKCIKDTFSGCDAVISVSSALRDDILSTFGTDSYVVPNVIDFDCFNYRRPLPHHGFKFISVAWLTKRKGMDTLLKAFRYVKNIFEDATLTICGDGPERLNLICIANQLELSDSVFFVGTKTPEELNELYNASDCFVLASRAETFGMVYVEAMACGLPVVATSCKGPADIVNSSNGITVPVDDVVGLSRAMISMCAAPEKYDRQLISESASDHYSHRAIAQATLDIYNKVLGRDS